jgi:hypothetical protein
MTVLRRIYRILHRDNVPWVLRHGIPCRNHPELDPGFVNIGDRSLIAKRCGRVVPVPPGGTLADYVPLYFCTHSLMLFKIHTKQVEGVDVGQSELVYVVSSIEKLRERGVAFLFTDRHAYVRGARFMSDPAELDSLDWPLIASRDFRRDPEDPEKIERRAAECLVHRHLPLEALHGFACLGQETQRRVQAALEEVGSSLPIKQRPDWYFS